MRKSLILFFLILILTASLKAQSWIRVNQLGYLPVSVKVAVFISTENIVPGSFTLCDAVTDKVVFKGTCRYYNGSDWGLKSAARLDFSAFSRPGGYYIKVNEVRSDPFRISTDVYRGTADFILRYMRQQRCGYNPFYGDSCHTHDGFIVDHPSRSGQIIDVTGGWHDASDYLQYVTTSANAVYQMLFAYSRNPEIYPDNYNASGIEGSNGIPDILDEAKWGIDWLIKMNPGKGEMYNQIADDRDHVGFRLPANDKASYGKGLYRPVYFVSGKPQGLARYKNRTTGVSSAAGKFSSAFALGAEVFRQYDPVLAERLSVKAADAWDFALTEPGVTQTACNVSPYFYEEDNYVDDLELAAWSMFSLTHDSAWLARADYWGTLEPQTPWIVLDTARHYQFYPFVNLGHAGLAGSRTSYSEKYISFMKRGLSIMEERRATDPFRIKIPFVWCSNNYVAAALTQHRLYAEISGDNSFRETEAALRDWLFGCNPWGTSMITGFPAGADYPSYPHSSLTYLTGRIPEGGLIDGPVFSGIYNNLKGLSLLRPDPYIPFQNGKVVYHDDIGDYSSNEPTMDGTASLSFYLSSLGKEGLKQSEKSIDETVIDQNGALVRKDISKKEIYLVFSADEFGEGLDYILNVLADHQAHGSFFLTGNFLRNPAFAGVAKRIISGGHFVGPHSDEHLLYADWTKRDSLLVSKDLFINDLKANYRELAKKKADLEGIRYFLPPYEWYNSAIAKWSSDMGLTLINFTPGPGTSADYTTPDMANYVSSDALLTRLENYESSDPRGLNGAIILIHPGTDPARTDKFYSKLDEILKYLTLKGYTFNKLN